jgi:hypothetical protein
MEVVPAVSQLAVIKVYSFAIDGVIFNITSVNRGVHC